MMQRFVHHDPEEHYFTLLAIARRRLPPHGRVRHRDQQHRPQGRALPRVRPRRRHLRHRPRRVVPHAVEAAHRHLGLRVRADPARRVRRPAAARPRTCAATSAARLDPCSTASSSTRCRPGVEHCSRPANTPTPTATTTPTPGPRSRTSPVRPRTTRVCGRPTHRRAGSTPIGRGARTLAGPARPWLAESAVTAAWMWARSELRTRWRAWVVLGMLAGATFGLAAAGVGRSPAHGRRRPALRRGVAHPDRGGARQRSVVRRRGASAASRHSPKCGRCSRSRSRSVSSSNRRRATAAHLIPASGPAGALLGGVIIKGRAADPAKADEIVIDQNMARATHTAHRVDDDDQSARIARRARAAPARLARAGRRPQLLADAARRGHRQVDRQLTQLVAVGRVLREVPGTASPGS